MPYFIVEREYLGYLGSEGGSTRDELLELLKNSDVEGRVVVIYGVEVPFTLPTEAETRKAFDPTTNHTRRNTTRLW